MPRAMPGLAAVALESGPGAGAMAVAVLIAVVVVAVALGQSIRRRRHGLKWLWVHRGRTTRMETDRPCLDMAKVGGT